MKLTMSTRQISQLTGKQHKHIKRDCDRMFKALDLNANEYTQNWTDLQNGQTYIEYLLDKNLVLTLVSGYSIILRNRIVNQLSELEVENLTLTQKYNELCLTLEPVEKVLSEAGYLLTVLGKKTKPMIQSKMKHLEELMQCDLFKENDGEA